MDILQDLRQKSSRLHRKIVLPESTEERTLRAVEMMTREQVCRPVLVGNVQDIRQRATDLRIELDPQIQILDPKRSEKTADFASDLFNMRKQKGMSYEQAKEYVTQDLFFGAMMVHRGDCHGMVAGAVTTTADVLRSAIYCVGLKPGIKTVSSIFLMVLENGQPVSFGDCAVVPYPDASQLADIAIASAQTHEQLTGENPVVAMLSFSTKGSADHEAVTKVREALAIAKSRNPSLVIDGELQFDAAFVESIGKRKAPGSQVAGRANVFIFPNLDAGNIAYKITERIGRAKAIGPVIQGVAKPVNDLSRGCSADDIVNVAAICSLKE